MMAAGAQPVRTCSGIISLCRATTAVVVNASTLPDMFFWYRRGGYLGLRRLVLVPKTHGLVSPEQFSPDITIVLCPFYNYFLMASPLPPCPQPADSMHSLILPDLAAVRAWKVIMYQNLPEFRHHVLVPKILIPVPGYSHRSISPPKAGQPLIQATLSFKRSFTLG